MIMKRCVLHVLDPEPNGHVGGADLHVVDLACEQQSHGRYRAAVLLLTESSLVAEKLNLGGVQVIPGYAMGGRYSHLPFRLSATIKQLSPDILHSHGYDANYFACWSRMITRSSWRMPSLVFTSHGWVDRPSLFVKTSLDLLTHRFADHIIICSPHQYRRARRAAGHSNITFICNGVPTDRMIGADRNTLNGRFGIPSNTRLVAFIGRLSPEKRPDVFVDVANIISRLIPDIHFVMAGGGPQEAEIDDQITRLGLNHRITMLGVVSDIDSLYRHLELLVLPSDMETTSRVTIEALMWGVPVVASKVGGIPQLISSGVEGLLCPAGDLHAFAHSVGVILDNLEVRTAMSNLGRAKAQEYFNIARMRGQVEDVYDTLLRC